LIHKRFTYSNSTMLPANFLNITAANFTGASPMPTSIRQGQGVAPMTHPSTSGENATYHRVGSFPPPLHGHGTTQLPLLILLPAIVSAFTDDMIDPQLRTPFSPLKPQHCQTTQPPPSMLLMRASVDAGSVDKGNHDPSPSRLSQSADKENHGSLTFPLHPSQLLEGWVAQNPNLEVIPS
jgi:hypothetical protein